MANATGGNAQAAPANGTTGTGSANTAPQDGTNPNDTELNNGDDPGDDPGTSSATPKTYTEAEVQAIRRQAAENRVKANKAEARLKELDDATKTDQQKAVDAATAATNRAAELEARLNAITRKTAITAAVSGTALYPDLIAEKISEADVPIDPDTGIVDAAALEKKVAQLRTQYPALFKASDQGGDAGATGRAPSPSGDMNAQIRGAFGRR